MGIGYDIISSPNWPLEVVNFLLEIKIEREKEVIKKIINPLGKQRKKCYSFF